jgi:(1->4)-alpha-D-glucan 1-alpha-D-glucosylmutase
VTPTSTYRLQIAPSFTLAQAADVVPYLARLGVSHLYASPLLVSTTGSAHGYDVVDHRTADPQRGGEEGRLVLTAALAEHGLSMVVDLVPNHMGVAVPVENAAWWDVLELGPQSAYGRWFDIDWSRGRVLLPVLGDGDAELDRLRVADGSLWYYDKRFPLAPGTLDITDPRKAHDCQHYELVGWRRAAEEQNYRRFFAISDLAGLRVEDAAVFERTHEEVLRWVAHGDVTGLRIDHPDGLTDPAGYFARLSQASNGTWTVVEKILEPGESLPDWPVAGTSGYDAMAEVDGVLVDPAAADAFTALDERLTGVRTDWAALVHDCKLGVATGMLHAEVRRMDALVPFPAAEQLAELLACFPVYRSYLPEGAEHLSAALSEAARRRPDLSFEALGELLRDPAEPVAIRFQQTSGAVMAKGVEDTAYYRWTRFLALNEVGGDPARFGLPLPEFHAAQARRQERFPTGMTSLSTHDTKRSADVRARLAVLSELPWVWAAAVDRWSSLAPPADGALGHLLWQTAVGAWPLTGERFYGYLDKAFREARTRTSWDDPDADFEAAMHAVAVQVIEPGALHSDIASFVAGLLPYWRSNALTQTLVQLTMPGVPDTYQGCELWDLSLVDPDNRRPVDFALRSALLERIESGWLPPVDEPNGAAKLLVVTRALHLLSSLTGYSPVHAAGPAADHLIGFDRGGAVTLGTRLPVGLSRAGGWGSTTVPVTGTDVLTGRVWSGEVLVADVLADYPVALIVP